MKERISAIDQKNTITITMVLLASLFSACADLYYREIKINFWMMLVSVAAYVLIYVILIKIIIKLLLKNNDAGRKDNNIESKMEKLDKNKLWGAFFAVYCVYLIVNYPGLCGWDTVNQILDLTTGMRPLPFAWMPGQVEISALMNDHHPVATTLLFTLFYRVGLIIGSAETGMFIYCVIQIAALSKAFSNTIVKLKKHGAPQIIVIGSIALYCMPFTAFFAISMIKDSIFSLFFVLYYSVYIDLIERATLFEEHNKTSGRRLWILLFLLSLIIAVTNKKGMYIAFISNLSLLLCVTTVRDKIKSVAVAIFPVALVVIILGHIVFPAAKIYPGGKQESLGFSLQQSAALYLDHPDAFDDADIEKVEKVLTIKADDIQNIYDSKCTDDVKNCFNYYATESDVADYRKMWIQHGIQHPITYLGASLRVNGGFFALCCPVSVVESTEYSDSINAFRQPDFLKRGRKALLELLYWLEDIPGVSLIFQNAIYCWLLPVSISIVFIQTNKKKELLVLVPIFANTIFLLLGPVCWTRYALCQIYTVPLMINTLFSSYKE